MAGQLSIKNFEKYQHYKDRRPLWIKLYNDLLDDYAFSQLADNTKWHLVALWLLASRYNNLIPNDPDWISKQIGATSAVDVSVLISLGFVTASESASNTLAHCKHDAIPEKRREEIERETENASDAGASGKVRKTPSGDHALLIQIFVDAWALHSRGGVYDFKDAKDGQAAGRLRKACKNDMEKVRRIISDYFSDSDPIIEKNGFSLSFLSCRLNTYLMRDSKRIGASNGDDPYKLKRFSARKNPGSTGKGPAAVA